MVQLQSDEVMLVVHEGVYVAKGKHGCIKKIKNKKTIKKTINMKIIGKQ